MKKKIQQISQKYPLSNIGFLLYTLKQIDFTVFV